MAEITLTNIFSEMPSHTFNYKLFCLSLSFIQKTVKTRLSTFVICFIYTTFCNMECFAENINDESVFSLKPFISIMLHDHHRNSRLRMQIILGDPF